MELNEWLPIYKSIIDDMGYDRSSDDNSARLLKALMQNANLVSDEDVSKKIQHTVTVTGRKFTSDDVNKIEGTLMAAGSSTKAVIDSGIIPDIIVTDLDGDIESQKIASVSGSITFMHAHGDNADLIMRYAKEFVGQVILTTQSTPDLMLSNFGGFTDGDRAVCIARHFGAKKIILLGFDFDDPITDDPKKMENKKKKLMWAKKIIYEQNTECAEMIIL